MMMGEIAITPLNDGDREIGGNPCRGYLRLRIG
jgi:hypothetical protein